MSSGIVLEMENICGNTEARENFLWSLQRKPQLLGDAAETTHSASPHVAEKNPKCSVTVNTHVESSNASSLTAFIRSRRASWYIVSPL
jgi:hypothetical protein